MLYLKTHYRLLKHTIVVPIISSVIIPLLIFDFWMELYHRTCFPLYGLPYVRRKDYIKIVDRAKLKYLNLLQKIYCMYCGYGNGVIRFWAKIAAETEHYWCGVKHEKDDAFKAGEHQNAFAEYGDENDFRNKYSPQH